MGSLSNLYISQSYQSLTHLGTNNALVPGTMTQLQDGIGQSLNISFDGTNISSSGNIYAANITGSGGSSINTGSFATTASFNAYTASNDSKVNQLINATSSYAISSSVATVDAAQQLQINSLISATGSYVTSSIPLTSLNAYTQSNDAKWTNLNNVSGAWVTESETGSFLVTASVNLNTITFTKGDTSTFNITVNTGSGGGGSTDITSLNAFTASQDTKNTTLASVTSSLNTATASLFTSTSLSLTTASFDSGTRNLTFTKGNTTQFSVNIPDASGSTETIYDTVYTGENITKGDPLYISGSQGANPIVYKANAADPLKMPVTYVSNQTIGASNTTSAIILGHIEGIDLTGYTAGQSIYVAEGGGWSASLPSGSASITQLLGIVTKGGNGGKGLVLNPGPAQLPGLDTGKMWVGNGNNQPIEITTASFASSASFNSYTSSNDTKWNTLGGQTGSFATTGSNSFNGNQIITGSLFVSSSNTSDIIVEGQVFISSSQSGSTTNAKLTISGSATGTQAGTRGASVVINPTSVALTRGGFSNTSNAFSNYINASSSVASYTAAGAQSQLIIAAASGISYDNEFIINADSTGIQLQDWNNTTTGYSTWLSIGPNDGVTIPIPQFTRGLSVSGSGGLQVTGSAHGNVVSMSITSNTASMDFNAGNYFELTASVSPLNINVINLSKGTTSTLSISGSTASTITFSPNVQQPSGSAYTASVSGQTDILSFVAFNSSKVNVVSTLKMI